MDQKKLTMGQACLLPGTLKRALKISLLIGTLLVLINQGDLLLAGKWPPLWKILLTYLVPFGVGCYAGAAMACQHANAEVSLPGKEGETS